MSNIFENKGAFAATIVVAASDSLNQAAANYVCDGVADEVEINAAIGALPATGGKVLLLEGNYDVADTIGIISGLTLQGQGANTILTWSGAADGYMTDDTGAANDVRITSIKFDANNSAGEAVRINGGGSRIRVDSCFFIGGKLDRVDIYIGTCDQVEIDHNFFDGTNGELAISAFTCDDVDIHDNIGVNGHAQSFISVGSSSDTRCYRNLVSNNIANGWGTGLDVYGNIDDVVISGGYYEGAVNDGIEVHGDGSATYYPLNVSVIGSEIKNAGRHGLHAEMHATLGVLLLDGFRAYNSGSNGILFESGYEFKASDVIIDSALNTGIEVSNCNFVELHSPTVRGVTNYQGIYIAGSCGQALLNNVAISSCGSSGIRVDPDNTVITGGYVIDNTGTGIDIHAADYCIVTGVRLTDTGGATQTQGIGDFSGSNHCIYKGNNLLGNTVIGIQIVGSNNVFDQAYHSIALDLTGGATDIEVFHANAPCILVGYTILYSVATGAGAGVNIRVGRYQDGVALDDDYFDVSVSELNKAKGYAKYFITTDLTQAVIAAGDTVTVGTAGGKADTGEVILILKIVEMAD